MLSVMEAIETALSPSVLPSAMTKSHPIRIEEACGPERHMVMMNFPGGGEDAVYQGTYEECLEWQKRREEVLAALAAWTVTVDAKEQARIAAIKARRQELLDNAGPEAVDFPAYCMRCDSLIRVGEIIIPGPGGGPEESFACGRGWDIWRLYHHGRRCPCLGD